MAGRLDQPRGASATLLAGLCLSLLRLLCGRREDGSALGGGGPGSAEGPCCGGAAADGSLPSPRFAWGPFTNFLTWPEVLRRYVHAADAES